MTGTSPAASTYLLADDDNKDAWKYVSYGCAIITIIMLVIIVAVKNKVNIAIGIVKETSKAVHDMKMMMLYPLITTSLLICLMVWWLIVAAYIMSSDGLTLNNIKGSGALDYKSPFSSTKDPVLLLNATEICQQGLNSPSTSSYCRFAMVRWRLRRCFLTHLEPLCLDLSLMYSRIPHMSDMRLRDC